MSNTKLEEEARRFLDQRSKESDPDKIRNELIEILEKFLTQLKNKGA
jgi:hypothetical protein